jgi:hypothetical protein
MDNNNGDEADEEVLYEDTIDFHFQQECDDWLMPIGFLIPYGNQRVALHFFEIPVTSNRIA